MFLKYNELKSKLEREGIFDIALKKPIPKFPSRIGVITSETGAVIRDIINVVRRRNKNTDIIIYPVNVQGKTAVMEIAKGLEFMDGYNTDILILARGGGLFEDFEPFNTQEVVMAIYNCNTPVISAIGHETDFSLADFASDLRAPTPSAAAELAVSDILDIKNNILSLAKFLQSETLSLYNKSLFQLKNNLEKLYLYNKINIKRGYSEILHSRDCIINLSNRQYYGRKHFIENALIKLDNLNPARILKQGYIKAYKDGKDVASVCELKKEDNIELKFSDGIAKAIINKITLKEGDGK